MNALCRNNSSSNSLKARAGIKKNKLILFPFILLSIFLSTTVFAQYEEHSLNMKLYVIEATEVPEKMSVMHEYMPAHLAHQFDLEKRGIMFGAGPLFNEDALDGPPSAGLIIIRAGSMKEAREIADTDPMHINGIRTYSIRLWRLNEGSFNVRVNLSDQTVEFK